jgi:Spy/CpxP family protein refolding chaperone
MQNITNKFRYGLMIGAIALAFPLAVRSAPWDCQNGHADSRQSAVLDMHDEMMMHMRQGMLLPPPPPGEMMSGPHFPNDGELIPPFLRGLDLSELQQDKIFELLYSQEPTVREQHKAVRKATEEMNRLAISDHYSPSEVRTLADKLAKAIADTLVLRTATESQLRALLTPEQHKQADELRSRFEAHLVHDKNPPQ